MRVTTDRAIQFVQTTLYPSLGACASRTIRVNLYVNYHTRTVVVIIIVIMTMHHHYGNFELEWTF